jgi:hypothetical protein
VPKVHVLLATLALLKMKTLTPAAKLRNGGVAEAL